MTTPINTQHGRNADLLPRIRQLAPPRALTIGEALYVAELQANRLLELSSVADGITPNEVVTDLPRVLVKYRELPTSGLSFWTGAAWLILLNRNEPLSRQRFTLFHELKHIIDHGAAGIFGDQPTQDGADSVYVRTVADYFAACALMPKRLVKRQFGRGLQSPTGLADDFGVSTQAMSIRLDQLGLTEQRDRCARVARAGMGAPKSIGATSALREGNRLTRSRLVITQQNLRQVAGGGI